mmetsp:Transcript_33422/g.62422  ORF Transcript_33422/g.62422 Transcript_33422/m.62422 type:complete len:200 (+) Transcript_33422:422-1021(+)
MRFPVKSKRLCRRPSRRWTRCSCLQSSLTASICIPARAQTRCRPPRQLKARQSSKTAMTKEIPLPPLGSPWSIACTTLSNHIHSRSFTIMRLRFCRSWRHELHPGRRRLVTLLLLMNFSQHSHPSEHLHRSQRFLPRQTCGMLQQSSLSPMCWIVLSSCPSLRAILTGTRHLHLEAAWGWPHHHFGTAVFKTASHRHPR